jgi:hypothetical protein
MEPVFRISFQITGRISDKPKLNPMKKLKYFFFAFLLFQTVTGLSQTWEVTWGKDFTKNRASFFVDGLSDTNGGYTLLGMAGNGVSDFWLVRMAESGDTLWNRFYRVSHPVIPHCLVQTSDQGYLMTGAVQVEDAKQEILLVRTDRDGEEVWRKTPEEAISCSGGEVVLLENGDFVLAGTKMENPQSGKLWLIRINSAGETIWSKTYEGDQPVTHKALALLPDGSITVAAQVVETNKYNSDIWVLRIDPEGEEIWSTRIPSPKARAWPECICCSGDNHLVVVGWYGTSFNDINGENPIVDYDLWMGKLNPEGQLVWSKNIDSEGSEGGNNITGRPDGSFLIAGKKETSFTGNIGPWLIHVDANGNILDEDLIKFHYHNDQATKIFTTPDGGFVVLGPGEQPEKNERAFAWIRKYKAQ